MLHFFKKIKKNTCRYHYQNLDDMIYSFWDIEQNILKLVILGHFLPFYPLKTPKIKILKNENICWRYHFTHVHQKHDHMMYGSWDTEWDRIFCHFGPFFALLSPPSPPLMIRKIKILKKKKKMKKVPGDIILLYIHVYDKWRSYDYDYYYYY